jgi:hypothetical protein
MWERIGNNNADTRGAGIEVESGNNKAGSKVSFLNAGQYYNWSKKKLTSWFLFGILTEVTGRLISGFTADCDSPKARLLKISRLKHS